MLEMNPLNPKEIPQWIGEMATALGFSATGIVPVSRLDQDADRLQEWLRMGYHGQMAYMAQNISKRSDPRELLPGAKTMILLLMNYNPERILKPDNNYKIARYAYGKDYHLVIREKLHQLATALNKAAGPMEYRVFTDSAPVLERAWAEKAGLGWIGKNTLLIHPQAGSFTFIGEIICTLEIESDTRRVNDLCGGCTRCIDACPTGAIIAPRLLDSEKCISYLTIEYRGALPADQEDRFDGWIFGCDICQEVCPWNRKAVPHHEPAFKPHPLLELMTREKWNNLSEQEFSEIFRHSAVKRTKYSGLKRNISYLQSINFETSNSAE